jgi:hypothetical protein
MPTGRELKKLLDPLLTRRKDLAFVGRMLFLVPVAHYLRGAFFEISRFHNIPMSVTFVHQLCNGQNSVDTMGNHGQRRYMMKDGWDADLKKASHELCERMEQYALPPVEHIVDHKQHEASPAYIGGFVGDLKSPKYVFTAALGACSAGDFDAAERVMAHLRLLRDEYPPSSASEDYRYSSLLFWRMAYLMRLLQEDRSRILPLLHDWEAHAVKGMRLTKYWKPTPFPAEL